MEKKKILILLLILAPFYSRAMEEGGSPEGGQRCPSLLRCFEITRDIASRGVLLCFLYFTGYRQPVSRGLEDCDRDCLWNKQKKELKES